MTAIRVACQTYTWEMLGTDWRGRVTDLLDWIAAAGYAGIEITNHFGPDTGHIVRGGQDLLPCLQAHRPRITHLHLKDVEPDRRTWTGLGRGMCDFRALLAMLEATGYTGWVVAEEESEDARQDGVAAIRRNREYLRQIGY